MIRETLLGRILVMDGAMGTQAQKYTHKYQFCDELNLTGPDIVQKIYSAYISAGAQITKTNTFNSNSIALSGTPFSTQIRELNLAAVSIARLSGSQLVAGVLGPTHMSASGISGFKKVDELELTLAYKEQAMALKEAEVDFFLVETIYDLKNGLAALEALKNLNIPVMISFTINSEGKLLSGESIAEFYQAIKNYHLYSVGLNCSSGISELTPFIRELAKISKHKLSIHPNAGYPQRTDYQEFSRLVSILIQENIVSIIGGCCGTDETYIKMISDTVKASGNDDP